MSNGEEVDLTSEERAALDPIVNESIEALQRLQDAAAGGSMPNPDLVAEATTKGGKAMGAAEFLMRMKGLHAGFELEIQPGPVGTYHLRLIRKA